MYYHLDPIGGVAGDMFAAAILDYHRDWRAALNEAIRGSGLASDLSVRALEHHDGVLTGHRFQVTEPSHSAEHPHTRWRDIREQLRNCSLDASVKQRAITIFKLLAEAEASVHGCSIEEVTFHEVGAWDSITDIVTAAWLIERCCATSWSCSPLPLGRGRVATAHGSLPVPAPATAELLKGFPVFDDGVDGERITPTGAAILKYLNPSFGARMAPGILCGQGYGFGNRAFPGFSNVLKVSVFDPQQSYAEDSSVAVCEFEVDDQTPEDLAIGLERLRELPGVLDVTQAPVFGKKGRVAMRIQVLGQVSQIDTILDHCLTETTTLGVRWHTARRTVLKRNEGSQILSGKEVRIKRASRPGGVVTRKVEIADLAGASGGHAGREQLRNEVHSRDVDEDGDNPNDAESGQ